jgi:hypothetical protein
MGNVAKPYRFTTLRLGRGLNNKWCQSMRGIILIGIAMTVMLAGIVAWAAPRHPTVVTSPFDPFTLEENAKDLPTQEWLNAHMWPNNTT